ncbi:hypothetical protein SODALDRAFT_119792 [Sodiomyces alkalinus F11]|uniref:Uncharacterized protein n=1 Tax=Sodiomyces alkalinus (strain CBS 110278 / VKM F-3762 / F11) TaxID=1314773 RepID=A0A3N2Q412_SODAK|nr:hypothetical protein SODALDRAFT_119792 [Sodiomyces alkalinus F11]ROT41447.1 hypothetical protein SODALDRAFT_119792 [Sodiomyces alkalinus F11]
MMFCFLKQQHHRSFAHRCPCHKESPPLRVRSCVPSTIHQSTSPPARPPAHSSLANTTSRPAGLPFVVWSVLFCLSLALPFCLSWLQVRKALRHPFRGQSETDLTTSECSVPRRSYGSRMGRSNTEGSVISGTYDDHPMTPVF